MNQSGSTNHFNPVKNYVIRPNGTGTTGPSSLAAKKFQKGFVFDGEEGINIQHDTSISTQSVADGTHVSDHVAMHPIGVTLVGYVGEIVFGHSPQNVPARSEAVQPKLVPINVDLKAFTSGLRKIYKTRISRVSMGDFRKLKKYALDGLQGFFQKHEEDREANTQTSVRVVGSAQSSAYAKIRKMQLDRQTVTLLTPYAVYPQMIIKNISISQDGTTLSRSAFTVELQEIKIAGKKSPGQDAEEQQAQSLQGIAEKGQVVAARIQNGSLLHDIYKRQVAHFKQKIDRFGGFL